MSYHPYWTQRNARDKASKLARIQREQDHFAIRVARAAVASVLPGCDMPSELDCYPVVICRANGSRLVCRHLA